MIDGDTFDVQTGERIRLANVCAPALTSPKGQLAKRELASLIQGKLVKIDQVGVSYGRVVADVHLAPNGLWVNEAMRRKGYKC